MTSPQACTDDKGGRSELGTAGLHILSLSPNTIPKRSNRGQPLCIFQDYRFDGYQITITLSVLMVSGSR